jgi:hypothetical protein
MISSPVAAILTATLVLPVVALANSHARAQLDHSGTPPFAAKASNKEPLKHEQTSSALGTVTAIDSKARLVALQTEGGQTLDVLAGDGVKNFDTIAVGDVVKATYTESVAFQVVTKGATQGGAWQSTDRIPGDGKVGHKVTSSFTVVSIDPTTNVMGVTLPDGTMKQIHFEEKAQTRLKSLNPGDVISATYSSSAATRLEKLAK